MNLLSLIPLNFSKKETIGLLVGAEGKLLCAIHSHKERWFRESRLVLQLFRW